METRMLLPQAPAVAVGAKRPPPASANQAQPDVGPPRTNIHPGRQFLSRWSNP